MPTTTRMPTNTQMALFGPCVTVLAAAVFGFVGAAAAVVRSATVALFGIPLTLVTVTASKSAVPMLS